MRWLYILLLYLLAPFLCVRLAWQALSGREKWRRVAERFGHVARREEGVASWVHAVSVGEVAAAEPLVRSLLERRDGPVIVTTTTATGSDRVRETFGDSVEHSSLPLDLPHVVARFLDRVRPRRAVIMETELWPTLFRALRERGIPLSIASGRISGKSLGRYRMLGGFIAETLNDCTLIAAQSEADADRFRELGAHGDRVKVMGNLKFDFELNGQQVARGRELRARMGQEDPVWIAASTHDGEEQAALQAHRQLLEVHPRATLILVPRHPERFEGVSQLLADSGLDCVRRSALADWTDSPEPIRTAVLLGDSMGELSAFYAAADVCFVGGSLVPVGGHNMLEPASLALPVVFGPYVANAQVAADLLVSAGGARQVETPGELAGVLVELMRQRELRQRMGDAARKAFESNRGALQRFLAMLDSAAP